MGFAGRSCSTQRAPLLDGGKRLDDREEAPRNRSPTATFGAGEAKQPLAPRVAERSRVRLVRLGVGRPWVEAIIPTRLMPSSA
jgi:hypothetical protein